MISTAIQLMLGMLIFLACIVGAVILKKYEQPWFTWFLFSLVALCLTLFVHANTISYAASQKFMTMALVLFAMIALGQFWNIMEFTK